MGNSSSGLGYDLGEAVQYKNSHWTLSAGLKKEDKDDREQVSIFRFLKNQADKLQPAQRCVQKIRTLRHPYVLTFLESADIEDSLLLVTEQCTPLEKWLEGVDLEDASPDVKESTVQELLWGFRCILNGLQFLHANNISHGYLGPQAIFVAKNGDWKIGCFDLACNLSNADDFAFFKAHVKLLQKPYISPERENFINGTSCSELTTGDSSGAGKGLAVNWHADIFAIAQCMKLAFERLGLEEPSSLSKYYPRMLSAEPKRRPTASQMEKCPVFSNDNIKLLISLGELALRAPPETLDVLKQLTSQVANIPQPVCLHKILPAVKNSLMIATSEFVNRDSREGCRQSIQLTLALLQELGSKHKMDEDSFVAQVLPSILQLWQMTDRVIRTALLHSLKQLVPYTPAGVINKSIFDPMLAGFADSNAKMREETLKSLVHVVEKLDEKHLQDKLVRCIMNLQNDGEASIRTNATIFLGRIATKLREAVRVRVLCPAFAKAMRDNFVHSRVAGLKAAIACTQLLEHSQLTTKVMPQVCTLLLDRSAEVRELSLTFLENCLKIIREQHETLTEAEKAAAVAAAQSHVGKTSSSSTTSSAARHYSSDDNVADGSKAGGGGGAASWTSWAVDGLSKTLEKATIGEKDKDTTKIGDAGKNYSSSSGTLVGSMDESAATVVTSSASSSSSTSRAASSAASKLGLPLRPVPKVEAAAPVVVTKLKASTDDSGWGDDWGDFDIDVDGDNNDGNDDNDDDDHDMKLTPTSSSTSRQQQAADNNKKDHGSMTIGKGSNNNVSKEKEKGAGKSSSSSTTATGSSSHESNSSFTMDDYAEFLDDLDLDDIDADGEVIKSNDKSKDKETEKKDNKSIATSKDRDREKAKEKGSGIVGTLGKSTTASTKPASTSKTTAAVKISGGSSSGGGGWGNDDDFDIDDANDDVGHSHAIVPVKKPTTTSTASSSLSIPASLSSTSAARAPVAAKPSAAGAAVKGMSLEKPVAGAVKLVTKAATAKPAVAVKKLARSSNDNWDDF